MTTALFARPVHVRIAVGQLFTATQTQHTEFCEPGESINRLWNDNHPYSQLWSKITRFYELAGLNDATDAAILDHVRIALRCPHTLSTHRATTPERMRSSIQLWNNYGWTDYETKRAGKMRVVKQYAMPAIYLTGLCFGVVLPQP